MCHRAGLGRVFPIVALFAFPFVFLVASAARAEPDRSELACIALQPSYVSASRLRAETCLRAVAFSPLDPNATPAAASVSYEQAKPSPGTIGIAVGDAGTILRSEDGGDSWWPIEDYVAEPSESATDPNRPTRRALDFFGNASQSRQASAAQLVPLPFCEFSDVIWGSPRDVIVVGGGYEPVTGISRGVCVFSSDAGRTWRLADAHEMPRMRELRIIERTELAATGDASEASGVNRFSSHDGGRTWVENILPSSGQSGSNDRAISPAEPIMIETAHGSVTIEDLCLTPDGGEIAVASHGRIFRRTADDPQWQAVRGAGRHPAVVIVAASPPQVPWSLVGRESLQERARAAILIDGRTLDRKQLDRCRAAASMLGVADVNRIQPTTSRDQWLHERRPAVIVLDDSLSPPVREAWLEAIETFRSGSLNHSNSIGTEPYRSPDRIAGPQRIVLSRFVGSNAFPQWNAASWQRAWNHSSVLRGNALLTGPGVLANDFSLDAALVVAPAFPLAGGVEVATLEDVSGSVRRDVSLTAGVSLSPGQKRAEADTDSASHRRLQITTARMNQTSRLLEELGEFQRRPHSAAEVAALTQRVEQLLAVTAAEDRTRLLWEAFSDLANRSDARLPVREMLLGLLARHAQPESIRRWASLAAEADAKSVELKMRSPIVRFTPRTARDAGGTANGSNLQSEDNYLPVAAPEKIQPAVANGQPVSPFQIRPVSYEAERTPVPQVLVPAARPTVWQSTRGLSNRLPSMPASDAIGLSSSDSPNATDRTARINWDYHPVVMGARGIESVSSRVPVSPVNRTSDGSVTSNSAASYRPPMTTVRPLLDGDDRDACWQVADVWRSDWLTNRCVADQEYLYLAITAELPGGVRLSIDCDGDYLTSLQFEWSSEGSVEAFVRGIGHVNPVCYHAMQSTPGQSEASVWVHEIAIARSSLPAPVCRIRTSLLEDRSGQWQVMPEPGQWHPSRKSARGR